MLFRNKVCKKSVIEVVRRGFIVDQHVYPVQVIASTDREIQEETKQQKELPFKLGESGQKKIMAAFDGGEITSDSGSLLLAGVDQAIELTQMLSQVTNEIHDMSYIKNKLC